MSDAAPWHAHIYFTEADSREAESLHRRLAALTAPGSTPQLRFVGRMAAGSVGPHPLPQFEIHFEQGERTAVAALLAASGLRALVHPLTSNDLADHTALAEWIGEPVPLDTTVLDPPGVNQGLDRFGSGDF